MIFCIFYEDNNLFLHQSLFKKPTPSQINFIKNAKNHFLLLKKFKNSESAQPRNTHCVNVSSNMINTDQQAQHSSATCSCYQASPHRLESFQLANR